MVITPESPGSLTTFPLFCMFIIFSWNADLSDWRSVFLGKPSVSITVQQQCTEMWSKAATGAQHCVHCEHSLLHAAQAVDQRVHESRLQGGRFTLELVIVLLSHYTPSPTEWKEEVRLDWGHYRRKHSTGGRAREKTDIFPAPVHREQPSSRVPGDNC